MDVVAETKPADGGGTPVTETPKPWLEQIEQSLRGNEALRGFSGPNDLAKDYLTKRTEVEKLQGELKTSIKLPGKDAKPEEIAAYRKAIGVPEKPGEYEFDKVEGMEDSPQMIEWFKGAAHRLGLPKDTAKGLRNEWNSMVSGMVKAEAEVQKKARDDARASLVKDAGGEEPYKVIETLADRVWKKTMGQDFATFVKETGFINNPYPIIKVITMLAKKTGEDFAPGGEPGKGGTVEKGIVYDKSPEPPARPH